MNMYKVTVKATFVVKSEDATDVGVKLRAAFNEANKHLGNYAAVDFEKNTVEVEKKEFGIPEAEVVS